MRKYFSFFLIILLTINLSACNKKPISRKASFIELFDTVTIVMSYDLKEDNFSDFAQEVYDELEIYHQLFDKYKDYDGINNIKTINDNAGIRPIKVDQKILDMLLFSLEINELTQDKVNIALGPVLEIWHDYRSQGVESPSLAKLPPMDDLETAASYTNIDGLIIDVQASTVYLRNENMSLDVGSIAKGFATEQVAQKMKDMGYDHFALNVGGNIRAIGGRSKENSPWHLAIKNPDLYSDNPTIYTLSIIDQSLVSSGDYERYYTVDGKQYNHIIDPDTLMPANYFTAISVVCQDSGMADALSTAIFTLPYEEGLALIDGLDNTEALWIFKDGSHKYSRNFQTYIIE